MAMFDPLTGEFNPLAYSLDVHEAEQEQPSLLTSASNFVMKGIPLTALSIVNSFANTGISLANVFGANIDKVTVNGQMEAIGADAGWAKYYDDHEQGIEGAGLLIGSLIPGLAAIKALKVAQSGKLGSILERATGVFSGPKQRIIDEAVLELKAGNNIFTQLDANKWQAIAYGFGDQALQAAVFETAVAGTMHGSPLLSNMDAIDVATNITFGAVLGGGIGGAIEGIFINRTIKQAQLFGEAATKASELTKRMGFEAGTTFRGVSAVGDELNVLLNSLDAIPEKSVNIFGAGKAELTRNNAILDARIKMQSYVGKGNEDVSNALVDVILDMRSNGGDKEQVFNLLAGLGKVGRVTEELAPLAASDVYYVHKFARGTSFTAADVFTSDVNKAADISLAYKFNKYAGKPYIATHADTVISPIDGTVVNLFNSSGDAWKAGADIYVSKIGVVTVNPNSPNLIRVARPGEARKLTNAEERVLGPDRTRGNLPDGSKPLLGATSILNVETGDIVTKATPVIGDYGPSRLFDKGLIYGGKSSIQNTSTVITAETKTIDANARYVWWSKRKLKATDTIDVEDAAGLEQMLNEAQSFKGGFSEFMSDLERRNISIAGLEADEVPATLQDLQQLIKNTKDDLIYDIVSKHPELSAEEIAIRANVPVDYISGASQEFTVNAAKWEKVNHIQLQYDIGNPLSADGNILSGLINSQYRISIIQDAAKAAVLKELGAKGESVIIANGYTAADANIQGAGGGFLSFASGAYNSLANAVERVGRITSNIIHDRINRDASLLLPSANAIKSDPLAAAELGIFVNARRSTNEQYVFLPEQIAANYGLSPNTVVLRAALKRDAKTGEILDWLEGYMPEGFQYGIKNADEATVMRAGLHNFYQLSDKVAAFERAQLAINDARLTSVNNMNAARGISKAHELGTLFAPPIDTRAYKFFALVRHHEGTAFSDGSTAMIVGQTAAELEAKADLLKKDFQIIFKDTSKKFHKAMGDYDYQRNFNDNAVNSELARRGILNNVFPDVRAETILQQYIDFNTRQTTRVVRDTVELGNAQLFAELTAIGERFTAAQTSSTGYVSKLLGKEAHNPYESYINTALNISDREQYPLWNNTAEKLDAFASRAFNHAVNLFKIAEKGVIPFEQVGPALERFGLGNAYESATNQLKAYKEIATQLPPSRILSRFVQTANSIQIATAIRLDVWQTVMNVISTPIMLMTEGASVKSLMETQLPGSSQMVPAVSKVIFNSLRNAFNADVRKEWLPIYESQGIIRKDVSEYFAMQDNLIMPTKSVSETVIGQKLKAAVDIADKFTGASWSEQFVRFVAADAARQIFTHQGMTGQLLLDNIGTFVNRIHGNYVAAQRPVAFQGPLGQAIGLFQSYQFNLLQNMFRYIENGEAKTLAILGGMQTTLFGLQSNPGFQMINQHIVGNATGNPAHKDIYSTTANYMDPVLGDYLMYGAVSNVLGAGLYSRGDINPRQITVLPLNPLNYPAISGGINFMSNLIETFQKIGKGGDLVNSMLVGLEHNGLSRPLGGLAQLMQGYVTNQNGNLINVTRNENTLGLNDLVNVANFSRLLGARPIDEAIQVDALYRRQAYVAKDSARMELLGEAAKTSMYGGKSVDPEAMENFVRNYSNSGGSPKRFAQEMLRWNLDANVSQGNQLLRELSKPVNQQTMIQMGGARTGDFFTGAGSTVPFNLPKQPIQ